MASALRWARALGKYNLKHAATPTKEEDVLRSLRDLYTGGNATTSSGGATAIASSASASSSSSSSSNSSSSGGGGGGGAVLDSKSDEKSNNDESPSAISMAIPKFFFKKRAPTELQLRVRKEARTRFLEQKAEALLDEHELETLWEHILVKRSRPHIIGQERLNYDAFCGVGALASPKAAPYFKASVFLKFPRDEHARISGKALYRYITKKVRLGQLRIALTCYDESGYGYLREQDLENYVFEQIPSLPQLTGLEVDFYPYYVFTAVRKFVFFLDPMRKGKIKISDLIASPILREFNQLRNAHSPPGSNNANSNAAANNPLTAGAGGGPGNGQGKKGRDWFTSRSALEVYATYLNLDVDHNGMLSKREFMRYGGGTLTSVFVDRLFQEYRMYESGDTGEMEMDYKTFLDFVLAIENKHTPQAINYFWKLLDIQRTGYLTVFALNYFFRAVCQKMIDLGHEAVDAGDVVANEIFDMVEPELPHQITIDDLLRSKVGGTIVSILSDVNGFWKYDNREVLIHNENNDQNNS